MKRFEACMEIGLEECHWIEPETLANTDSRVTRDHVLGCDYALRVTDNEGRASYERLYTDSELATKLDAYRRWRLDANS